tara:strand:+ start:9976 stop:11781 length:1806 start_codon:yes stop_codon:yes gene_type:complete
MLGLIKQLLLLLTDKQLKRFYLLQILVVVMAFAELLGIASIAPFMALVGDISLLETNSIFSYFYQISGIESPTDFLFYTGAIVLVMLTISTLVSMLTVWKLSMFGAHIGTELADRLYRYYMQQSWQFHASGSSAQLTKQVSTEAARISMDIIQPLMRMNAKLVLALFISISIVIYNPVIALLGLLIFSLSYFLLYSLVRKKLVDNGQKLSDISTQRFRLMNEGFGGIKDILLLSRSHDFIERFQKSGRVFARAQGANIAISQVPRYFIELITFGAMVSLVLVLLKLHSGNLGEVLPILAVYALAAFKLLPALQQIYASVTQIKGNIAAFEAVRDDLERSFETQNVNTGTSKLNEMSLKHSISFKDIEFSYPNKDRAAVSNVNMSIPANSVIGLVGSGSSGSGKSTLIDLLLGLLIPQQGCIYIDDVRITATNKRAWQNLLGFVPQSIFLSEGTIAENVAFGVLKKDINFQQVENALYLANLNELVEQLSDGINTKVGERGVQLSGGQRQRIGIARALYHEAEVLVFDEATSALDGITEKIVMDAIHEFSGKKTIVMIAHRLKTVEKCDLIYLMEQGKIMDSGTYKELIKNNIKFREMAEHA